MPSSTQGFSKEELVTHVAQFTGNFSDTFSEWLGNAIWLAQSRYCKMHDWKWLNKRDLRLELTSGTRNYTLDTDSLGYYMRAEDVRRVFSEQTNTYLDAISLDDMRRRDANADSGAVGAPVTAWAPGGGDNEILVYPRAFVDSFVRVDGKITPPPILEDEDYLVIPPHMQDAFVEYVKALALQYGNDSRAQAQMQAAFQLVRQDVQNDQSNLGGVNLPSFKSYQQGQLGMRTTTSDTLWNCLFGS
jgi:hypothetical protein